jgi:hypothetical protein
MIGFRKIDIVILSLHIIHSYALREENKECGRNVQLIEMLHLA